MEIDFESFNNLDNRVILDLRDSFSYQIFHIPNSINILYTTLLINMDKYLKKDVNYLLVCEHGYKSLKTSNILNMHGYHTYSLKKGIKGYKSL